jgi:hypothetical protein
MTELWETWKGFVLAKANLRPVYTPFKLKDLFEQNAQNDWIGLIGGEECSISGAERQRLGKAFRNQFGKNGVGFGDFAHMERLDLEKNGSNVRLFQRVGV